MCQVLFPKTTEHRYTLPMDLKTIVFIGRSGCGKGTQADLLIEELKRRDSEHPVVYIETGEGFRAFLTKDTHSSALAREVYASGALQPEFLAVYMWSDALTKSMVGNEHLILDGTPRKAREALVLDSAFSFYKRVRPTIIHVNVSSAWSRERLHERHRADDIDPAEVEKRLAWFDADVVPAIEWYKTAPGYQYSEINGEQPIEAVHADIMSAVFGK